MTTRSRRGRQSVVVLLAAAALANGGSSPRAQERLAESAFEGPVPRAECGPDNQPETDLQGRVPRVDRDSGRSQEGYRCNLELVGQYQGQGTTYVSPSYEHCAYHGQAFPGSQASSAPGVHVVDVRDERAPGRTALLTSPAFLGTPWESLKVNETRGLLAGTSVGFLLGTAFFDIYDISQDCTRPVLLNSVANTDLTLPAEALAHEGDFSPDGNTYWSTGGLPAVVTAIDVSDPTTPRVLYTGVTGEGNHGLSISEDGNGLYLANLNPPGLRIFDISAVQARMLAPTIVEVGNVFWEDGGNGQHAIDVTWDEVPYVVFVDEMGQGGVRIIDISDETAPTVGSKLKLEIHMPEAAEARAEDLGPFEYDNGIFGYEAHYCAVDRREDPTALACGFFSSGVRVFDVRDPRAPREIAYFNPPAQVGKAAELPGSEHAQGLVISGGPASLPDLTTDWCSSPPRFVDDRLWVHCQDNGFMVLRFTNGAYPFVEADRPPTPPPAPLPVTGR